MKTLAVSAVLAIAAMLFAPTAQADMKVGNYELQIQNRYDFHTWLWMVSPCQDGPEGCLVVRSRAQPIAKAFEYTGEVRLKDGQYTMTVDVPDGLRCGNVYYGPVIPTRDTYRWDAETLDGTLESSFATNCGGAPGGTYTYPFQLVRW